jgi:hypothetical protein
MHSPVRLSDLQLIPPLPGTAACVCLICDRETDRGWIVSPSENFNAWDIVRDETGRFCEWCWAMLKTPACRKKSWIGTPGQITYFEGAELGRLGQWLLEPTVPCAVSLTSGHRKVRWLLLGRYISTDPRRLWVATDWAGRVLLDTTDRRSLELAEQLLARGVRRTTLRTGRPTPNEWATAIREGWQSELAEAVERAGDPAWEVWVHVAAKP